MTTLRDNTECPETITIGTNELIGTDPNKLPPALARLMAGQWKKGRFHRCGMEKWRSGLWSVSKACWDGGAGEFDGAEQTMTLDLI